MPYKKSIAAILLFCLAGSFTVSAESGAINQAALITDLQNIIRNYGEMINTLKNENEKLKSRISELEKTIGSPKSDANSATIQPAPVPTPSSPSQPTTIQSPNQSLVSQGAPNLSLSEKYTLLMDKVHSLSGRIFKENDVPEGSQVGLFEFIEPSNFFISIDDFKNPSGVTTFSRKILFSYDNDFILKVDGVFKFDFNAKAYVTVSGKNPFAKATRTKIKNPYYKGKLLDSADALSGVQTSPTTGNQGSTVPASPTVNPSAGNASDVTFDAVKTAYRKNKITEALRLVNLYLQKDPNNIEALKIRYNCYNLLRKYKEAIADIQKIESLLPSDKVEKIVYCDARNIAKMMNDSELQAKYTALCKKK